MRSLFLAVILCASAAHAQKIDSLEGLWQGYEPEWGHVSRQLVALAEAFPVDKFDWRPAPGVRSTGEVVMHIAISNFYLLNATGPKLPEGLTPDMEKTVTRKAEIIDWLKRSLDAVQTAHAPLTPAELQRKVKINDRTAKSDGVYLRILVHANEHMGQLIAYARLNGVEPPWSESAK